MKVLIESQVSCLRESCCGCLDVVRQNGYLVLSCNECGEKYGSANMCLEQGVINAAIELARYTKETRLGRAVDAYEKFI